MKTFKITNTFTNTTTTEEHENIQQAWRSIEKTIAVQASEDIDNNGLEENWQDYYPTEYHAHAAHALNFLHFRRQEYEVVEVTEPTEAQDTYLPLDYFTEKAFNILREQTETVRSHYRLKSLLRVVNDIKNEANESIVTGDISTIIYDLEQMNFTTEDILYRLEEALKGYTFELDTENGDTITLKERN